MKKLLASVGVAFAVASFSVSASGPQLFKEYRYGAQEKEFVNNAAYYDCSEDVGAPALCIDEINFLSAEFTGVLTFQEKQLQSFSLVSEFSELVYQRAIAALVQKFQLSVLQSENDRLDLVALQREISNQSEFAARVNAFESVALNQGMLTYAFLDSKNKTRGRAKNVVELIQQLPEDAREVDLTVGEDAYDSWLTLKFMLPVLQMKQTEQLLRKPTENF